jgi:hypothetical protein
MSALELYRRFKRSKQHHGMMEMEGDSWLKTFFTWICIGFLIVGLVINILGV